MDYLIEKVIQGDREACRTLYESFSKAMYNVCFRLMNSEEEAMDALQDTFVSVFQNLQSLNESQLLPAWIKKICVNTCLKKIEKKKKINWVSIDEQPVFINLNTEDELIDEDEYSNKLEAILWAVEQLPEKYRVVFNLFAIENYSHEQISEMLLIPSATCRSQYMRAKQKIIELIKKNIRYAGSIQTVSSRA